ncbi:MAG: GNAT family N-acetyltransferase [Chloroflexi bacterium]|nr:GNAT family N-acetyltransferase [Chloroflexota bacterium]
MSIHESQLDHLGNPILASLLTTLRPFSQIITSEHGIAARLDSRSLPLAGYHAQSSDQAMPLVEKMLADFHVIGLISYNEIERASLKQRFKVRVGFPIIQMVFMERPHDNWPIGPVEELRTSDYGEMKALVDLTQPGPFGEDSPRIGRFIGIRADGRLTAMGGLRMQSNRVAELTVICTHPDYRRRGFANRIVTALVDDLLTSNLTPFLHVHPQNTGAIAVYERLGFERRREGEVMVLQS